MIDFKHARGRTLALVAACAAGIAAAPATANAGFFDQLFGGGMAAPQVPEYQPPSPGYVPQDNFGTPLRSRPRHAHKKVAAIAVEKAPVRQQTTALMDDKTLRPGDAVMMKTGLRVYDGPTEKHHEKDQFVRLGEADMPAKQREALAALDLTHRAPLATSGAVQEGRSAAEKLPVSAGYRITDARGQSIRYVGP